MLATAMGIKLALIGLLALAVLSHAEENPKPEPANDASEEKSSIRRQAVFGGTNFTA